MSQPIDFGDLFICDSFYLVFQNLTTITKKLHFILEFMVYVVPLRN